mmetsp:Transcript_25097/g.52122  ORF Transcript_25097/g.52122 Transcript_25097/m.52122 type:complete len:104 (+) Transcript_25097:261-572(+)
MQMHERGETAGDGEEPVLTTRKGDATPTTTKIKTSRTKIEALDIVGGRASLVGGKCLWRWELNSWSRVREWSEAWRLGAVCQHGKNAELYYFQTAFGSKTRLV